MMSLFRRLAKFVILEKLISTGVIILVFYLFAGTFPSLVNGGIDPLEIDFDAYHTPPDGRHIFGTDGNGMDVWSRTLHAIRIDLFISITSVTSAVFLGMVLGLVAGYFGGAVDMIFMRILDIFQAFPIFILALTIAAILGPGIFNLIFVIAIVNAPAYARLIRAEARTISQLDFIYSARLSGTSHLKILVRHILPNSLLPIRVIAPLNCGWAILTLAGLSFLGLGIPVPQPEWGSMIGAGTSDIVSGIWWTSVVPGVALVLCVFGFTLIGEGLQERARKV